MTAATITAAVGNREADMVRQLFERGWSRGDLAVVDEFVAEDAVAHHEGMPPGRESWKQAIVMYRTAFPDLHYDIDDLFAAGDKVVIRWRASGTDRGGFMGMPPTGRHARDITGINIYRVRNGRLVEHWDNWDVAGLMQQLGVLPAMALPE